MSTSGPYSVINDFYLHSEYGYAYSEGSIDGHSTEKRGVAGVYPLLSTVKVSGGNGTITNPYVLKTSPDQKLVLANWLRALEIE